MVRVLGTGLTGHLGNIEEPIKALREVYNEPAAEAGSGFGGAKACSDLLTVNALVEVLDERGIIWKKEMLDRIKALQASVQTSNP